MDIKEDINYFKKFYKKISKKLNNIKKDNYSDNLENNIKNIIYTRKELESDSDFEDIEKINIPLILNPEVKKNKNLVINMNKINRSRTSDYKTFINLGIINKKLTTVNKMLKSSNPN